MVSYNNILHIQMLNISIVQVIKLTNFKVNSTNIFLVLNIDVTV